MSMHRLAPARLLLGTLAAACFALNGGVALAADHAEAPGTRLDGAADLADVYAWHDTAEDRLVVILTIPGDVDPDGVEQPLFDPGVLYTVNLDTDGDYLADTTIDIRFFRGLFGQWRMVVRNLPGAPELFIAPTQRPVRVRRETRVYAGLRDDPFFFDLEGFRQTLQTGTLGFDGNRDSFAGRNVTAIVLEMPLSAAAGNSSNLNLWAHTGRR